MGVPKAEHYSSIPRVSNFTGGRTIRDWLTGQSFDDQYRFGKGVIERLQRGLPVATASGVTGQALDEASAIHKQYRRWILDWEAARAASVREANQITKASQAYALHIVSSATGREAIESLLKDPSIGVRLAAAVETLRWNPKAGSDVIKEVSRREKGIYGFEAEVVLGELKLGRLNLNWQPVRGQRLADTGQPRPSDAQLDAVVAVHSATMSGGFFYSLSALGPLFSAAIAGYEGIGLRSAANLLRKSVAALPWSQMPVDHDERAALIDRLPDAVGAHLEDLAGAYHELLPSDAILFDAIEAVTP